MQLSPTEFVIAILLVVLLMIGIALLFGGSGGSHGK
jgi:hypothetical protein